MTMWRIGLCTAALAALGSCAGPKETPPPARAPAPVAMPAPRPVAPRPADPGLPWIDAPLSAGDWSLAEREARFGPAGAPTFVVRCVAPGQIVLARTSAASASSITVRASNASRTLAARGAGTAIEAALAAGDPLLDAMFFSRGRYAVEVPGMERLIVPSWPEPARVVEDCRS